MKKSRSFLAVLIVSLSYVLSPVTAKADLWDVPVLPGQSFRWVFVTSEFTNATSTDISYYNDFVNGLADDAATPISGVLGKPTIAYIDWKAIASTEAVNARDNIEYSFAPIYTPTSILVADDYDDLFDGNISHQINITELGDEYDFWPDNPSPVWTGSNENGYGREDLVLGLPDGELPESYYAGWGNASRTPFYWIEQGSDSADTLYPLYAISEELTVVPVPGALILGATGLLSSTLGLIRLRRKHQEPGQI